MRKFKDKALRDKNGKKVPIRKEIPKLFHKMQINKSSVSWWTNTKKKRKYFSIKILYLELKFMKSEKYWLNLLNGLKLSCLVSQYKLRRNFYRKNSFAIIIWWSVKMLWWMIWLRLLTVPKMELYNYNKELLNQKLSDQPVLKVFKVLPKVKKLELVVIHRVKL